MNNTKCKAQVELVKDIACKIENTTFESVYFRWDPEIEFITIVHPYLSMAPLVGCIVEGAPEPADMTPFFGMQLLQSVPSVRKLMADCDNPASPDHAIAIKIRATLNTFRAHEVRAFYCPPNYFVQFLTIPLN